MRKICNLLACALICNMQMVSQTTAGYVGIDGISISNFPIIDGSDSTEPLRTILMCKLLGYDYVWERMMFAQYGGDAKRVMPQYTCSDEERHHITDNCIDSR